MTTKLLALLIVALISAGGQAAQVLYPTSLHDKRGGSSDQQVEVLSVLDQVNDQDEWDKYIEFYTGRKGYDGVFRFNVPAGLTDIKRIELVANYRGSDASSQKWIFQIRDNRGRWRSIADNASAESWVWSKIFGSIDKSISRYIDSRNRITIRFKTDSRLDNGQLDYLAINLHATGTINNPVPVPQPKPETPKPEPVDPVSNIGIWKPAPGLKWQIQYTGTINTTLPVDVYNIDLFDTSKQVIDSLHANGKRVICYFSAGSFENWRPDANSFPMSVLGRNLDGWPGERWLDVRRLDVLMPIMQARMKLAAEKGCDAVDPDNVDGYSNNTGFNLSYDDQIAYLTALSDAAHDLGLAIGLKNNVEQIKDLANLFDFAVNEECFQWDECDALLPFVNAGKAVFGIEYNLANSSFCPQANNMNFDFIKKRLELDEFMQSCR